MCFRCHRKRIDRFASTLKFLVRFRLLQRTVVPKNRKSLQQLGSIDSLGNWFHGCHQAPSKTDKNAKTTRHLAHDSNEHYFS